MSGSRSTGRKLTPRFCLPICLLLLVTNTALHQARAATNTDANDPAANAASLFADATNLRAEQREATNLQAIAKYREAAVLWRAAGKLDDAAVALRNAGELLRLLGNTSAARQAFEEALTLAQKTRNRGEEARVHNDLAYLYFLIGDTAKAQPHASAAFKLALALRDRTNEAQALSNLGEAFYNLGDLSQAKNYQQRSLAICRELGDQHGQVIALVATGYYDVNLGEPAKAINAFAEGLSIARAVNDLRLETLALTAIGNIKRKLGERQEALSSYHAAKLQAERIGDKTSLAVVKSGIGVVFFEMGDYRNAFEYVAAAVKLFEANGQKWGAAEAKLDLGKILQAGGEDQEALDTLNEALALFRSLSMQRLESITLRTIGLVYSSRGDVRSALASFQKALSLLNPGKDQRHTAYTLNYIGKAYEDLNQPDRAQGYYAKALELAKRSQDPQAEGLSLYRLAHLERGRGNLEQAATHIKAAIDIAEKTRTNVSSQELRTSYFATVRDNYDLYIDILMLQHKRDPSAGFDREAFAVSEKARARSFFELLLESQAKGREGAAVLPRTLTLEETQEHLLDNETTLIEFALGNERSYAWVITRNSRAVVELPAREEIQIEARTLYAAFTEHQLVNGESIETRIDREVKAAYALPGAISSLSKMLLGPLARELKTKRLLVVADGALQYIPFQVLINPETGARLIECHEIVNEPSASSLALVLSEIKNRKPAANLVAVLADPVFEITDPRIQRNANYSLAQPAMMLVLRSALRDVRITADGMEIPRLFASGREANEILALAPRNRSLKAVGFEANINRIFSPELARYRIVHIATHGIVDNDYPERSGIVLSLYDSEGRLQDGFLRLPDIYNLKLPADLVVLSACSTALGRDVKGEGLVGLTRGFMYAGAAGVVASLWKIDDEATAELMKHFYAALLQKGLTPAAALRDAQLELAKQPRWNSPYYWAGFVIQGQYDQKESFRPSGSGKTIAVVAVIGGLLLVASVLFLRRRRRVTVNA
ncbi:MAG TPA: CHAT domain-containing protein [Pyrinomonadaceae bacterium]|nr:CHAT domain-containing protein [Pyrinomonadaceae bacterium]